MYAALKNLKAFLAFSILFTFSVPICAWDTDLELFDLVEEIPQSFYEFLSVEQVSWNLELGSSP